MNKKFCQKCNQVTFYEDSLPKGCSHCLSPFASTLASQASSSFEIELEEPETPPSRPKVRQQPIQQEYRPQSSRLNKSGREPDYEDEIAPESELQIDSFEFAEPEIDINNLPRRNTIRAENIVFDKNVGRKENLNRQKLKINKKDIDKDFKESINRNGKNNSFELGGQL